MCFFHEMIVFYTSYLSLIREFEFFKVVSIYHYLSPSTLECLSTHALDSLSTHAQLVFTRKPQAMYNNSFIYICSVPRQESFNTISVGDGRRTTGDDWNRGNIGLVEYSFGYRLPEVQESVQSQTKPRSALEERRMRRSPSVSVSKLSKEVSESACPTAPYQTIPWKWNRYKYSV